MSAVKAAFTAKLRDRVKQLQISPGLTPGMDLGPLATEKQLQTVLNYIEIGKGEATLLCGGERLTGGVYDHGHYPSPAVFDHGTQTMRIAHEEIFGPMLAIVKATDFHDAIAKANDSE